MTSFQLFSEATLYFLLALLFARNWPFYLCRTVVRSYGRTVERSYGRTTKFFGLDGLLLPLFGIVMGLRSASSATTELVDDKKRPEKNSGPNGI